MKEYTPLGVFHVFKIVQMVTKSRNASHIRKTALSVKLFKREKQSRKGLYLPNASAV